MLNGKTILLGVTGSIAAYKAADLASKLVQRGASVHAILTQNATQFISPVTFETLTGNKCLVDTFDRNFQFQVAHISLAKAANLMIIAPASANFLAKAANGIADDMLTTTTLACNAPKLVAPAMNTQMYENPITQRNLATLKSFGFTVIEPAEGHLACGDSGRGKMESPEVLLDWVEQTIAYEKDFSGKRVLVTAGPTQEPIDPVRFLTNHSSGKMGYALAKIAARRGADVTLITGKTSLIPPRFAHVVPVTTAQDMYDAVEAAAPNQDMIFMAAAVADYRPKQVFPEKWKKSEDDTELSLVRTKDILAEIGRKKLPGQLICGFAMETEHLLENARRKLVLKRLDMICANSLREEDAGFSGDTNRVTILTKDAEIPLPLFSKEDTAEKILDAALRQSLKSGGMFP